jgi:hypothetical protein
MCVCVCVCAFVCARASAILYYPKSGPSAFYTKIVILFVGEAVGGFLSKV